MEKLTPKEFIEFKKRLRSIIWIFVLLFIIIIFRMVKFQIVDAKKYKKLASNNSIRFIPRRAPRGIIVDRNNKILVKNKLSYTVAVIPDDLKKKKPTLKLLSKIIGSDYNNLKDTIDKKLNKLEIIKIKSNITRNELSQIEEESVNLPGVVIYTEPHRYYKEDLRTSHLIGYVGEVGEDKLLLNMSRYIMGDFVGQMGVEKFYDDEIRGKNGFLQVLVNAMGHQVKTLKKVNAKIGKKITLTIDYELQKKAEELLSKTKNNGALVILNPQNGEVLALVSKPDFELSMFNRRISMEEWMKLVKNPSKPFTNRVVSGYYAPGSIIKPIIAIAGIRNNIITPRNTIKCNGKFKYNEWEYKCWKDEGHNLVNLYKAISESCDVYFYKLGLKLGINKIVNILHLFNFGNYTGINLPFEKIGLVPTPSWKIRHFNENWFPGNTIHLSIGQGFIKVTPIQIITAYSIIANEGVCYKPHIVKSIGTKVIKPEVLKRVSISKNIYKVIKKALWNVVNTKTGTGRLAKVAGLMVCGKTSTIQVANKKPIAAFVGFAPLSNPKVSIVVLIEDSGYGGEIAAPIVRKLLKLWKKKYG